MLRYQLESNLGGTLNIKLSDMDSDKDTCMRALQLMRQTQ